MGERICNEFVFCRSFVLVPKSCVVRVSIMSSSAGSFIFAGWFQLLPRHRLLDAVFYSLDHCIANCWLGALTCSGCVLI